MTKNREQPLRDASEREVRERIGSREFAERLYDDVILPIHIQAELKAQGIPVDLRLADTNPDATDGYPATCRGCGATARLPQPVTPGCCVLCPPCQLKHLGLSGQ
jgi:hypothetical protein